MKHDDENKKVFEFVQYSNDLNIKVFVSRLLSLNSSKFHWHREIEMLLVINGPITIYTESTRYQLETGDIFFLNSNEAHCLQRMRDMNSVLAIQLPPNFCESYYPEMKKIRFIDNSIKPKGSTQIYYDCIYQNITELMTVLHEKMVGYPFKAMNVINGIFYYLVRYGKYEIINKEKQIKETRNMNRLNRIISFMQENFANKISLSTLAETEALDMYYLSHFIKKYLGMSFQQYLNKLRLTKATELLANSDKKNIDICLESGFSDYRYFCKALAKEYQCTPSQYKKRYPQKQIPKMPEIKASEEGNDQYRILDWEETFQVFFDFLYNHQ